ncbi:hypothetical protein GF386_02905 [Candidatus Pacearchaeota archaeon]|nr:hypothetical protein [Candidatus Pacearchaeota archaeon]MBD3283098.1 hypothetical protein [Candidatus Pacearchaeota archaeon]
MKKNTSEILLIVGILIILLSVIISTNFFYSLVKDSSLTWFLFIIYIILSPILNPLGVIGIILVTISLKKSKKTKGKNKKIPSWLKGSLAGTLVGFVLFLIKIYNISFCEIKAKANLMCLILKLSDLIGYHQIPLLRLVFVAFGRTTFILLTPVFFVLEFILLGALITLLSKKIEKLKEKLI